MNITDIITLLTLVIAIVAILNEKNRMHIMLKFSQFDVVLLIFSFFLINYFVFYRSFYDRNIYVHAMYFAHFGFRNPKNWAYLITICSLIYILYKIYFSFFPNRRTSAVIDYYNRQVENGEFDFVADLINRYHVEDIARYVNTGPEYDPEVNWHNRFGDHETRKERFDRVILTVLAHAFPFSWTNRSVYARLVLNNVIATPAFLDLVSPLRPYFFTPFFSQFKQRNRDRFSKELINRYLVKLLAERIFWLEKELKQSTHNAPTQPEWFFEENRILASLWTDLSVADVSETWRPFGDAALDELKMERTKGITSDLFNKSRGEENLWKYTTYWSIQFFYAMINQVIEVRYRHSHFFLFYYSYMLDEMLETIKDYRPTPTQEGKIIYDELINEIKSNIFSWVDQANRKEHPDLWFNILDCIGACVYSICCSKLLEDHIIEWLDHMLHAYCGLEKNKYTDSLRSKYEEIMRRPTMLANPGDAYYQYFNTAWKQFDKIPHRSPGARSQEYAYFTRLKEKVIIPLGMDPKAY